MERTEEDIVIQAGIKVILGGKDYSITPLVIRDSREWRRSVISLLAPVSQYTNVTTDEPDAFVEALTEMLVTMPDRVLDLFFGYAKELDREEIEGIATDSEIAKAFSEVVKVAFPLAQAAVDTVAKLSR